MRTTIRIDDELLRRLKVKSAETGRSVGDLIEDAVRLALDRESGSRRRLERFTTFGSKGVMPGVDLTSNAAMRDTMDEGVERSAPR